MSNGTQDIGQEFEAFRRSQKKGPPTVGEEFEVFRKQQASPTPGLERRVPAPLPAIGKVKPAPKSAAVGPEPAPKAQDLGRYFPPGTPDPSAALRAGDVTSRPPVFPAPKPGVVSEGARRLREGARVPLIKRLTGKSLQEFVEPRLPAVGPGRAIVVEEPTAPPGIVPGMPGARLPGLPPRQIQAVSAPQGAAADSVRLAAGLLDFFGSPEGIAAAALTSTGVGAIAVPAFYAAEQLPEAKHAIEEWAKDPGDPDKIQQALLIPGFVALLSSAAGRGAKGLPEMIRQRAARPEEASTLRLTEGEAAPAPGLAPAPILPGMAARVAATKPARVPTAEAPTPTRIAGEFEAFRQRRRGPQKPAEVEPLKEPSAPQAQAGIPESVEALRGERPTLPSVERETQPAEVVKKSDIIREISAKLNVPIRVGRFRQQALGIFKVRAEVARSRLAQDLPTITHEVGHFINKVLWGTGPRGNLNWKPLASYRAELTPIATKPRAGQSSLPEGFAEFLRMYLTNPPEAKAKAPNFFDFFGRELEKVPELRDTLAQAQADIRRWNEQPAVAKVLSQISKADTGRPANRLSNLYTNFKDALYPIQKAVKGMAKGRRVPTEENAYELARLGAGWWGKAEHFLERGTFDPITLKPTGKSLTEALRPVESQLDNFRAYLVARRAVEKAGQGKETGIEFATAREAVTQLESPVFQRAAQELYTYQDSLLTYLRDSGMLSQEQYGRIKQMNQDYVPFFRLLESPLGAVGGGKKTFADLWTPVKRMKGSGREIVDPLESVVKNTYTYLNLAERNRVGQALVRQAERSEGAGQWIEEVPAPQRPAQFQLEEIKRTLRKAGADLSEADLEATATIFRPSTFTPSQEGILAVFEGGKRRFFQVQPELYRALKGMDAESSNLVIRLLSMPARALRLGATSLGPEFVIRNPLRDTMTAFMQSRHGFKPGVDTIRGLFHALKRDDLYWEWKRSGGEHAALVALDRTTLQQGLADLLRSRTGWAARHPIEALRVVSERLEAATRLGEFQRARKQGATPRAAGLASREVTLDFARIGAQTRALNSIVAFWNAAVEGTDKFARVHMTNPKGTVAKGVAGITLPSLLLYAINKDDPKYQEQPRWLKDFFWLIPTRGTPMEKETPFIPIPKPFLWGVVYGSVPERAMEWIDEKDPSAFDEMLNSLSTATLPSMIPTAAIPIYEVMANRSAFTGRRLEPRHMERVEPQYRAKPFTSEFSKKTAQAIWRLSLGKGLKSAGVEVSPIKLDQAIFSTTGGLGRAVVHGLDRPLRDKEGPLPPTGTMADKPLLRAFAIRWPTGGAESVRQFYERLNELEMKLGTLKFEKRYPGRAPGASTLTPAEEAELKRLRNANKRMQRLSRAIRVVYSSKASPEEKRRQLDTYMLQMLEISRAVLGKPKADFQLTPPLPKNFAPAPGLQ